MKNTLISRLTKAGIPVDGGMIPKSKVGEAVAILIEAQQKMVLAGATSIDFEMKGQASRADIEKAFMEQKRYDMMNSDDDDDGYTGDFQTVNVVNYKYLGKVFESYDEAYKFALDKAEKWETVVAVYYNDKKGDINTLVAGWGAT